MRHQQWNGGIIYCGLRTFQWETPSRGAVPPTNRNRFANHPMLGSLFQIEKFCMSTDRCFRDESRGNSEQVWGGLSKKDADG
jgi:hypothetical protein